jgi:flagellar M-ring protein FliF
MEKVLIVFKQLLEFWNGLSLGKRLALGLGTVGVLCGVLLVSVLGGRVDYAYLYTNLDPKDAAGIAKKLGELQVPFQVDANGTALLVPREKVHALRLEMASSGLPSGGSVGNEIFDQANLGATEFEQQVNLRRALEGELTRSIMTIEGVEHARVHLVLPKNRLFAAKSEGASASVIVRLRNRDAFGRQEVASIVHLVATAVPNLTRDRVSVVDANGATLHSPDQNGEGLAGGADGSEQARAAEIGIEQRVRSLLERTTGPGAVDVRVKLELNPSTRERTEEHYEPTSTALRSEQKSEELSGTEQATVAGVPGAQTNLPDVEPAVAGEAAAAAGNILQRSHTRNWEIDRVVEKILTPAGDLRRLSIAVLVDGRYEEKEGQRVFLPRSNDELVALSSVVQGAVGFDAERGDRIELHAVRFAQPELSEVAAPAVVAPWRKYLPYAAAALATLFALVFFLLVRRGKAKRMKQLALVAAERGVVDARPAMVSAEARLVSSQESAEEEALQLMHRRSEALQLASSDPASAALVLREWLNNPETSGASRANG